MSSGHTMAGADERVCLIQAPAAIRTPASAFKIGRSPLFVTIKNGDTFHQSAMRPEIGCGAMLYCAIVPHGNRTRPPTETASHLGTANLGAKLTEKVLAFLLVHVVYLCESTGEDPIDEQNSLTCLGMGACNGVNGRGQLAVHGVMRLPDMHGFECLDSLLGCLTEAFP